MRIPGLKTAKKLSCWVQAQVFGGAIILGYHYVAHRAVEPDLCVSPEHFAEQMEVVSKYARPISLLQLVHDSANGSLRAQSIAVTFDDGYADTLYHAKPILEKCGIPATVFVCTGYIGKEFWWDELDRLIMSSKADLNALRSELRAIPLELDRPVGSPDPGSDPLDSRHKQMRRMLYHHLLSLDVEPRESVMSAIRAWSGPISDESSARRTLTCDELIQLTNCGLVELGAHTKNHPMLPRLSLQRQQDEIISCKRELEDLLGRQVTGFSYPNGRSTDDAKRIIQEAGFDYACTSLEDVVRPACDRYELPRFWQRNVDGHKFLRHLKFWGAA